MKQNKIDLSSEELKIVEFLTNLRERFGKAKGDETTLAELRLEHAIILQEMIGGEV